MPGQTLFFFFFWNKKQSKAKAKKIMTVSIMASWLRNSWNLQCFAIQLYSFSFVYRKDKAKSPRLSQNKRLLQISLLFGTCIFCMMNLIIYFISKIHFWWGLFWWLQMLLDFQQLVKSKINKHFFSNTKSKCKIEFEECA